MCGRYVAPDQAAIERLWHIGRRSNNNPFRQRFNVLPTTAIPILRSGSDPSALDLTEARWGFIPRWWKQNKPPTNTINARSEEAAGKPMWGHAYRHSRCLIPVVGWYEWHEVMHVDEATGAVKLIKQPHFIFPADKRLVCFAALLSQSGEDKLSCAILTRDAAPSVASVHDRMPVVLPGDAFAAWLDPGLDDAAKVGAMVREHARTDFEHYPVSARLNSARTDDPEFIERAPSV